MKRPEIYGIIFLLSFCFLWSCVPQKDLKYVQNVYGQNDNVFSNERQVKTIQPNDFLYIQVLSVDDKTASIFSNTTSLMSNLDINTISYQINNAGYLEFPFVGQILLKDLTLKEAKTKIEAALSQYVSNISVNLKFVNNTITLLGEVGRQGRYTFPNDQISVFDALGLAGGMTDYGNRRNLTLIREANGKITYSTIDLTDKKIAASVNYYLKPNDILIVEPIKARYSGLRQYGLESTLIGAISAVLAGISAYALWWPIIHK
jgi:polysaccharide biosynthesis/export protein